MLKIGRPCALTLLLLGAYAWSQALPDVSKGTHDEAKAFVEEVLQKYDLGQFKSIYEKSFHSTLKSRGTIDDWDDYSKTNARNAGKVLQRSLSKETSSMGVWRFIFDTRHSEGRIFEDITVTREDGHWTIMAFGLTPNYDDVNWQDINTTGADPGARAAVDEALRLYDLGKYQEMYEQSHAWQKKSTNLSNWLQYIHSTAGQTGKVISRKAYKRANSLGIERFLFDTQCTEGRVYEDVGALDDHGRWKLYFFVVKPNLE